MTEAELYAEFRAAVLAEQEAAQRGRDAELAFERAEQAHAAASAELRRLQRKTQVLDWRLRVVMAGKADPGPQE